MWNGLIRKFEERWAEIPDITYEQAYSAIVKEAIGASDFYSQNLRALGHEASEVIANCAYLQGLWAKDKGPIEQTSPIFQVGNPTSFWKGLGKGVSGLGRLGRPFYSLARNVRDRLVENRKRGLHQILIAQVQQYKPDVFFTHAIPFLDRDTLKEIRRHVRLVVGQHASPIPREAPLDCYDLLISSLPNQVSYFQSKGIKARYLKWCFEPVVLQMIGQQPKHFDVSFVGGFSNYHECGWKIFEDIAREIPIHFWGYGAESLPAESPIRKCFHGEAWGLDMYRILGQGKIVLNRHINVAENFANNMRLYEATGVGAFLLTDAKCNLGELFEVGSEVVAYRDAGECSAMIKYYLNHDDERMAIARAGQRRTLSEHTYEKRMGELVGIIEETLSELKK
jgi:spore maturation protein CgeB